MSPGIIAIAGASGVIGSHLAAYARKKGWTVRVLTRRSTAGEAVGEPNTFTWDPERATSGDQDALAPLVDCIDGVDVLVNLAGASLADGRLSKRHRERVLNSRVWSTTALVRAAAKCSDPPRVWVQASATGFYGDCEEQIVDETAPRGDLFLSEVCHQWEEAAAAVSDLRTPPRLIMTRLGLVLARDAPAWKKMLTPIRLGLGGRLGSGCQWLPWMHADDVAAAMFHLTTHSDVSGPINFVSPEPVRQIELVRQTARKLRRPAVIPAPAFALRLALGGVADELLLPSCRAAADTLESTGFSFRYPTVDSALDELLRR